MPPQMASQACTVGQHIYFSLVVEWISFKTEVCLDSGNKIVSYHRVVEKVKGRAGGQPHKFLP